MTRSQRGDNRDLAVTAELTGGTVVPRRTGAHIHLDVPDRPFQVRIGAATDEAAQEEVAYRTMAAYVIVNVDVTDPVGYEAYRPLTAASIEAAGGRYLTAWWGVRGARRIDAGAPSRRPRVPRRRHRTFLVRRRGVPGGPRRPQGHREPVDHPRRGHPLTEPVHGSLRGLTVNLTIISVDRLDVYGFASARSEEEGDVR